MKILNNKKKIILGIIIGVLVGTLLSVSYAMFTYSRTGITSQLVAGDIYMKYQEGSALNLSGVMPSSTYPNASTGNYFQFQIVGKNTSSGDISYNLKLVHGDVPGGKSESNRIGDQWLYFKLVEVDGNAETTIVNDAHFDSISNSLLHTMMVPAGTNSETSRTFRLYARISETLGIGNGTGVTYSQSEWNNLFASIKVNADGGYVGTVTINFNANGGTVSPSSKTISQAATTYGNLPTPTSSNGENFDGWYTALSGGTKILSTTPFNYGTSSTELYAIWSNASWHFVNSISGPPTECGKYCYSICEANNTSIWSCDEGLGDDYNYIPGSVSGSLCWCKY